MGRPKGSWVACVCVDAEEPVNRGQEVLRVIGALDRTGSDSVRLSDHPAHRQSTAGIEDRHRAGPVIATDTAIFVFQSWSPTELAGDDQQYSLIQSAIQQFVDQRRQHVVILRESRPHLTRQVPVYRVVVPVVRLAARPVTVPFERDKPHPGLHQSAGYSGRLDVEWFLAGC